MFSNIYSKVDISHLEQFINTTSHHNISEIIKKDRLSYLDFLLLLSPAATNHLEEMVQRAQNITTRYFGKTISFYTPIYLSNVCKNKCLYCDFNAQLNSNHKILTKKEMLLEFKLLQKKGFSNVLLLTGDAPKQVGVNYLLNAVSNAKKYFSEISLEVFPCTVKEYKKLAEEGVTGLTIYQETYDKNVYDKVHLSGDKKDIIWRLNTPDRAFIAGFKKVGLGILLGLSDWRKDIALLAKHVKYLLKTYWKGELSISFPRLTKVPANFAIPNPVSDIELVQLITALRLFFPEINFVLSTRESSSLRNHLLGIGITTMSAGSKTNPGGYQNLPTKAQFNIKDDRSLKEMIATVKNSGFDPILKNWDPVI